MRQLAAYTAGIENLVDECLRASTGGEVLRDPRVANVLDGGPGRELRRLVPSQEAKAAGAFFTSRVLADDLLSLVSPRLLRRGSVVDPTCGSGDLLLAAARILKAGDTAKRTLATWTKALAGWDRQEVFVKLARNRLALAAIASGNSRPRQLLLEANSWFGNVEPGDFFARREQLAEYSIVLLNPPFTLAVPEVRPSWGDGLVNAAAVFLDCAVQSARPGARVLAILPDVLRSGARYAKWRSHVQQWATLEKIRLGGQFDNWTDVHVFLARFQIRSHPPRQLKTSVSTLVGVKGVVERFFDVQVGRVVPHRHPESGPLVSYLHSRNASPWGAVERIQEKRRFGGGLFKPPFVVIRRTSRPGDTHRAVSTLVMGKRQVAVENHLIVLKPKTGGVAACKRLLAVLRSEATTKWLNRQIRCRHLTLHAVRLIPYERASK
jgi:hypothetical protein